MAAHPTGYARALFTDDVNSATAVLTERGRARGAWIVCSFGVPAPLDELTARVVEALGDGALARWPAWYGETSSPQGDVLERWREQASERAARGGRPLIPDLHLGVQARQLGLALDRENLRIAIVWRATGGLEAVARSSEWLAAETGSRVAVVLSEGLVGQSALDRIAYQSATLRFADGDGDDSPAECAEVVVHPVLGRPHPLSRVEQRLAQVLGQADDLRRLFEFNQRINTARGSCCIVDLVWRAGRVIVEIDGWETHGNRCAFALDRQRDYELALSGYVVMRITNDEILDDAAKAVDKIRDVVRFRRGDAGAR